MLFRDNVHASIADYKLQSTRKQVPDTCAHKYLPLSLVTKGINKGYKTKVLNTPNTRSIITHARHVLSPIVMSPNTF